MSFEKIVFRMLLISLLISSVCVLLFFLGYYYGNNNANKNNDIKLNEKINKSDKDTITIILNK